MRIKQILLILAAAIVYGFAVLFCLSAEEDANRIYLLLSEPIDAAKAEDIFTQEANLTDSVGFCFWGEKNHQWLACIETNGIAEVTQVFLSGNPGLLDASILTWQEGCLVDESTAQKLFGTADCSQQSAWCEGRSYRVFGTISSMQPTMVTIAEKADGAVLNRCVLHVEPEQGRQAAQQFLMRWGLTGQIIDLYPLWVAVYDLLLILPGILVFTIALNGLRQFLILSFPDKMKPIILLIVTIALFVLLCSQILILPDMIPSQWSDFSFWGNWWEEQRKNFQLVLRTPMGERHLQMMMDMVKSILSSTAAILLTIWILRRQKHADTAD